MPTGLWPRLARAAAGLLLLALSGCADTPSVATSNIPHILPQQARIWIYRMPIGGAESGISPQVSINGSVVGEAVQGRAFYRDVHPGIYHVTVASDRVDARQAANMVLTAGETVYVKIVQLDNWANGLGHMSMTNYAWQIAPDVAHDDVAPLDFGGGGIFTGAAP